MCNSYTVGVRTTKAIFIQLNELNDQDELGTK